MNFELLPTTLSLLEFWPRAACSETQVCGNGVCPIASQWPFSPRFSSQLAPCQAGRPYWSIFDKAAQQMTVAVDGQALYTWKVSTGKAGYSTPSGTFKPFRMERRKHRSV